MKKSELKDHVRAIQRAVESLLPEDEPDCTRDWVYETAVNVIADRLARQLGPLAEQLANYETSRAVLRTAERRYGLDGAEALEMAYDNLKADARRVLTSLRPYLSKTAESLSNGRG